MSTKNSNRKLVRHLSEAKFNKIKKTESCIKIDLLKTQE